MTARLMAGPDVRMCGNPGCRGWKACDGIRLTRRTMAIAEHLDPALPQDAVLRLMRVGLAGDCASGSDGVRRLIPGGCEFTVHKGWGAVPPESRQVGKECYTAVYSGPDRDLDQILTGSPEATDEAVADRLRATLALLAA